MGIGRLCAQVILTGPEVNLTVLGCLKWTQLVLAIATAISLGIVFFPSVQVILLLPICCLYVLWSARTINDHRLSMWLACATSLIGEGWKSVRTVKIDADCQPITFYGTGLRPRIWVARLDKNQNKDLRLVGEEAVGGAWIFHAPFRGSLTYANP